MKILAKCPVCKERKLLIKARTYYTIHAGAITGQQDICRKCYKGTYEMLGNEIKHTSWYKLR